MKQIAYRGQTVVQRDEFMVRNSSDVPDSAEPGTIFYTADMSYMAQADEDGVIREIGAAEEDDT